LFTVCVVIVLRWMVSIVLLAPIDVMDRKKDCVDSVDVGLFVRPICLEVGGISSLSGIVLGSKSLLYEFTILSKPVVQGKTVGSLLSYDLLPPSKCRLHTVDHFVDFFIYLFRIRFNHSFLLGFGFGNL
jgi:hypothetical protein